MRIVWLQDAPLRALDAAVECLRNQGHSVHRLDLPTDNFDVAVAQAQAAVESDVPNVIVGIALGGAVALHLKTGAAGLVLVCPEWRAAGTVRLASTETIILHDRADPIVAWSESRELARLSGARLIDMGADHRQADSPAGAVIAWACEMLATGQTLPDLDDDDEAESATPSALQEIGYVCDACGEEIVVPLDLSEGASQTFVEDCPVCCRANKIHVEIDPQSEIVVWAEPEQDRV